MVSLANRHAHKQPTAARENVNVESFMSESSSPRSDKPNTTACQPTHRFTAQHITDTRIQTRQRCRKEPARNTGSCLLSVGIVTVCCAHAHIYKKNNHFIKLTHSVVTFVLLCHCPLVGASPALRFEDKG